MLSSLFHKNPGVPPFFFVTCFPKNDKGRFLGKGRCLTALAILTVPAFVVAKTQLVDEVFDQCLGFFEAFSPAGIAAVQQKHQI